MNFAFNDQQVDIQRSARALLAERMPLESVARVCEGDPRPADALWLEVVALGWPSIFVGEDCGGLGLGVVELAILCEELGYSLAPIPFWSIAAAGIVLRSVADKQQRERWLAPLAQGRLRATLALADGDRATTLAGRALSGTKGAVPFDPGCELFIVAVADGFVAVPRDAAGVHVESVAALDTTRPLATIRFEGAPGEPLTAGGSAARQLARCAVDAVMAAECAGVAQRALDAAVEYAKHRHQFGVPIGAFQAVSHLCADMLRDVTGTRAAAYGAAWACDHDPGGARLASQIAKSFALEAAVRVCEGAIQVHGGIGFTWESHLHLLLRRAESNAHLLGSATDAREAVAALIGI